MAIVSRFLDVLHSGHVLLMDGAMGTELQKAGVAEGAYESWNLTHPESVRAIHQAYVNAGAQLLLTNTFQASRIGAPDFERVATSALRLARSAAGEGGFVLYDVGPFGAPGRRMGGWGALNAARRDAADGLLVETVSECADVAALVKYGRRQGITTASLPILVSWTFLRHADGRILTIHGMSPEQCATEATRYPIAALGVNCGKDIGMDEVIEIIRRYRAVTEVPLFARPNAGTPTREGERWIYPLAPQQMAARLPQLLHAGVSMVGGCCGTTPEHIATCRLIIEAWNA